MILYSLLRSQTTAQLLSSQFAVSFRSAGGKCGRTGVWTSVDGVDRVDANGDTPIRRYADTLLFPVRYPNVLHLGGVPEELFALALFGGVPVARFTVGDPGRL